MTKMNCNTNEIWTEDLTKIYGRGQKQLIAVNSISFALKPGIHGFLGPNGAGKTSTINMLIGAISVTSGKAKIRDFKIGSIKALRLIGFLPQNAPFYGNMTGHQYLLYMARLNRLTKAEALTKIEELLIFFDLVEVKDKKIGKYSGGMKQKLGIATALIHEPEILILDEPTANLDPLARADIISKIKELSKRMSVFVSSHILSEIEQMCERVLIINKGKILVSDTIKNIKKMSSASANLFVIDTSDNRKMIEILNAKNMIKEAHIRESDNRIVVIANENNNDVFQSIIPQLVVENKLKLIGFYQQESSLQDVFVELIGGDI
ncbi:MAG: ABC transporter ATP-binding protein [Candidatus Lokiarchaeota archaeon]|nr:ABC transporter ATP-binding protein [Candidatus Lokiarchaeota archaeon]